MFVGNLVGNCNIQVVLFRTVPREHWLI